MISLVILLQNNNKKQPSNKAELGKIIILRSHITTLCFKLMEASLWNQRSGDAFCLHICSSPVLIISQETWAINTVCDENTLSHYWKKVISPWDTPCLLGIYEYGDNVTSSRKITINYV